MDRNEKLTDYEHAQAVRAAFDTLSDAMAKATEAGLAVTFPAGTFAVAYDRPHPAKEMVTRLASKLEISRTRTTRY